MKILLATSSYPPEISGHSSYVKDFCERMSPDHEITVLAYTNVSVPLPKTRLIPVKKHQPMPVRILKYTLKVLWHGRSADSIYVQNAMAAGLPVALATRILRKPFILKFGGDEAWERATQHKLTTQRLGQFLRKPEGGWKIKLMMRLQKFVLHKASAVTTPSAYIREEIVRAYGINPEKVQVNYNPEEKKEILPFAVKKQINHIVTFSPLVAWRHVEVLIKALSILKKKIPNAALTIVGTGPELAHLKKLSTDLNLGGSISFISSVSNVERSYLLEQSSVQVALMSADDMPKYILPSFSAAIPVVAVNVFGENELFEHEKNGLLIQSPDENLISEALERILTNPSLVRTLTDNATHLLERTFSWQTHISSLTRTMNRLKR